MFGLFSSKSLAKTTLLMFTLLSVPIHGAEEGEWYWSSQYSFSTGNEVGTDSGYANSYGEAEAAMKGSCSFCGNLGLYSQAENTIGAKWFTFRPDPQDYPANYDGWTNDLAERIEAYKNRYPSSAECSPTDVAPKGGWYNQFDPDYEPPIRQVKDLIVTTNYYSHSDKSCTPYVRDATAGATRKRDPICDNGYVPITLYDPLTKVCRGVFSGAIKSPTQVCDCKEEYEYGQCVSREVTWESAIKSSRHGNYLQVSEPNNEGLSCGRIVPSKSCPAESELTGTGLVGNPIHCADGQKIQYETDYKAPIGNLEVSRIYLNEPQSDDQEAFHRNSFNSFPNNVQLLSYYKIDDPSWLLNIPRLLDFGGGLKAVQPGNGARYLFYNLSPSQAHSGKLEEGEEDGHTYTAINGTKYLFDGEGKITRKQYRNNQYVDYYFADGQLTIADNFGRLVLLTHGPRPLKGNNEIGPVYTITDPAGQVTQLGYTDKGMVGSVRYPGSSSSKSYAYQGIGSGVGLIGITDELGIEYARWSYDGDARGVLSAHHNDAEKVEIDFTESNHDEGKFSSVTREYRDANNFLETEYEFETKNGSRKPVRITEKDCLDCAPATKEYSYDSQGMLSQVKVLGGQTIDYSYRTSGLLNSQTIGAGTDTEYRTSISWHSDYSIPLSISDPGGYVLYTHDTNGNVLTETQVDSTTGTRRISSFTYNAVGQVLSIDGPRTDVNDITNFQYDLNGNLLQITNALNHITQITAHDAHGKPTRIVDPNGIVTELSYHPRGWLETTRVNGDLTTYDYNAIGLMTKVTMPNDVELSYEYDTARRLSAIVDGIGNRIEYSIDLYGNRTLTEIKDPSGVVRSHVNQAYNNLGQLLTSTGAADQQQSWSYDVDGNVISSTDQIGKQTQSEFDALRRLTEQVDPDQYSTEFEYDKHQQVNKVIDAEGKETSYKRNRFGDIIEQVSPDTGAQYFTYDSAGNRLTAKDARGVIATYTYDILNRVTSISFPDDVDNIVYSYDDTSEQDYALGRLTKVEDESSSSKYSYDAKGQVISETRTINGVEFVTQYQYDKAGLLSQIIYPGGRAITYQRDNAGQIEQVSEVGQGVLAQSISYAPFGPVESLSYGNGIQLAREYDQDYRMTRNQVDSVFDLSYQHTLRNNISAINNATGSYDSQSFEYDSLQRLKFANSVSGIEQYTHDAIGNRLSAQLDQTPPLLNYQYAHSSHRLKVLAEPVAGDPVDPLPAQFATLATSWTSVLWTSDVGDLQLYSCPENLYTATVYGSDIYASHSSVCSAAAHQGLLDLTAGGHVLIEVMGPQDSFDASTNNGIISRVYGSYWNSYRVIPVPTEYTNIITTNANPWNETANSYRNQIGEEFVFGCPPNDATTFSIRGTDRYAANSSICGSAVHAGALNKQTGGEVSILIEEPYNGYVGSLQNGLTSYSYAQTYGGFSLIFPEDTPSTVRYHYDAAGNIVRKGELRFSYDQLGRVKTASKPTMAARYVYDANNLRAQKTVNGITTIYLYDLSGLLIAESDEFGNIQVEYVYSDGMRLAMYVGGQRYYIHSNHLDAPLALTDASGSVQWQANITPFGDTIIGVENVVQNLRFPGQYFDAETGLHYNWHRYYDPEIGRYIQSDPIGLSDGPSTYNYVHGNPVNSYDPNGLASSVSGCANPRNIPSCVAAGILPARYAKLGLGAGAIATGYLGREHGSDILAMCGIGDDEPDDPFKPVNQLPSHTLPAGVEVATGGPGQDPDDEDEPTDSYENPGHHDPSRRGPNPYNNSKSVLPRNHEQLWKQSRLGPDGNRWTKVGSGRKAEFHRFQNDGNGNWHWNGSTSGVTRNGSPRAIKLDDVPIRIRR